MCKNFFQDGIWVASSDYKNASPDPLRDVAEDIVNQINSNNMEDIFRFCNVYVDLDFVVSKFNMLCKYLKVSNLDNIVSLLPISGAKLVVSLQISYT